ncbi:SPW repeat protein [Halopelagius longus]|uniref:SPW repeat-containing protein n=1 Tax=Halopelagius longus TaxID=1236180 RepID=A0A1H1BCE9_9EURY|nr:SPW repeat protein [Halopelagius longus]RDI70732.1 hypothetical protein DWB78_02750 [Halopelagius longus]SDQ49577.1 SPW repeat-containing protein [Halopelagius longus]
MSERDRTTAETATDYDPNPGERGKWLSAVIGLLGLWMLAQAVLFELAASQFWNDVLVGALFLVVGAYNYYRRSNERIGNVAAAAVAALVGLWLIVAPFVLGVDAGATETANDLGFWNDVVVGLIAAVIGGYSAYKARDRREDVRRTAT